MLDIYELEITLLEMKKTGHIDLFHGVRTLDTKMYKPLSKPPLRELGKSSAYLSCTVEKLVRLAL